MKSKISLITLIAMILGGSFGKFLPDLVDKIAFIGTWYINILKVLIVPVVFCSVSISINKSRKQKSNLVFKSVAVFACMFTAAFLLSSLVVFIMEPSKGFVLDVVEWSGKTNEPMNFGGFLLNLLPRSFKDVYMGSKLFFVLIISYLTGLLSSYFDKSDKFIDFIALIKKYVYLVLELLIYVTPFAVFSLMANTVKNYGSFLFGVGIKYIITAYVAGIVVLFVIMIAPVAIISKKRPSIFIRKIYRIWLMTLSTCSSGATLPYTVKLCKEDLDIDEKLVDVVVPLGCTINMCGGAVSFSLLGIFCSKLFGADFNLGTYLLMLVYAVIINMAAPGIPNGGVVIGASFLEMLGIPLSFIGFYSGIYKILDMLYTSLNVTGDISACVMIAESEKKSR